MNINKEWLLSNRKGSYSSSTVSFANTRSYHGLLVSSINDRHDRWVMLSKLFEIFENKGVKFSLDTNYYPDTIYPQGYKLIRNYASFPYPIVTFQHGDIAVQKEIILHPQEDHLVIRYTFPKVIPERISLFPLVAFRPSYSLFEKRSFDAAESKNARVTAFRSGELKFNIISQLKYVPGGDWYRKFEYPEEKDRGYAWQEDLFNPGHFEGELTNRQLEINVSETDRPIDFETVKSYYFNEMGLRKRVSGIEEIKASSTFFLTNDNIIAGFHWFGTWARDALISIPGLLLCRRKYDLARKVLSNYLEHSENGIVPRSLDTNDNKVTADSTLWLFYAFYKYYIYSRDKEFLEESYEKLERLIYDYSKGNEFFELDGSFVTLKKPGLTWMDARIGDLSMTPRIGKPVDINALWFNALSTIKYFSAELEKDFPKDLEQIMAELKDTFQRKFIRGKKFLDTCDPDDFSLRPNFLFAYSLPFPVIKTQFHDYISQVDEFLLTPYGLRTLSSEDPNFEPIYEGDLHSRDKAYHNGTVWPWLVGPYITAAKRFGVSASDLFSYFRPLYEHSLVPEIYDGVDPQVGRGCIAQAWSHAELIRAYEEDLKPT